MQLALEELLKCPAHPKIGAVISKNEIVLSTGFRGEVNGKHAERVAIEKLRSDQLLGSTIHTTLEPCVEMYADQKVCSCCELIAKSGISTICIGALDPNGKIYAKGMTFLRKTGLTVQLFSPAIRQQIEGTTFKYDDFSNAIGDGKRRVRSVKNGKKFTVQFSHTDKRTVSFRLNPLNMPPDHIDLVANNDSVRLAPGANAFSEILDPFLYQDASHFVRLPEGQIAIIAEPNATMVLLVKILGVTPTDIDLQWQVREVGCD